MQILDTGERNIKVVVGGHFGSGKTTFIKTLSKGDFLSSEKRTFEEFEHHKKETTTVSMDFATFKDGNIKFSIFGLPGQYRFRFMWEILAKNTDGFILLLDSTDPTRWPELFRQVYLFKRINPNSVFLFAANKQDLPGALKPHEIKEKLNFFKRDNYKIVPVVAHDYDSVVSVIRTLKEEIERNNFLQNKVAVA
jgi:small GTP-binding protein